MLFVATSRMPMVAGWDNLIPRWFSKLSPRWGTPVNSILFIGAWSLAFAAAAMTNVGEQEAFQLLGNAAGILYAFSYLVLFAVPLFGLGRTGQRAPIWIRVFAAAGFLTTTLYMVLSVLPIVKVDSVLSFALKIGVTVVATVLVGLVLYIVGRRRRRALEARVPQAQVVSERGDPGRK
jgi:amino acid transporter